MLEVLTGDMLKFHQEDQPWIAGIAPGRTIAFGQRLIEDASRILFNALHYPAKLGIAEGSSTSVIDTAIRGSRRIFRYFWRLVACVN